ncbi:MAG: hypothetical protein MZU97_00880 [Bacillus subtilis]|nr:hypothetical protein [Bacillus subtilis]
MRRDKRKHDVREIGEHASAAGLAAIILNVVGSDKIEIDFVLDQLVAAENDRRLNLPHEEILVLGVVNGEILFGRKIKGKTTDFS